MVKAAKSIQERLRSGGLAALLGMILIVLLNLGINFALARLLPPSDVGIYFLAFNILTFGALIGNLGLNQSAVRFVAESMGLNQPQRARKVIQLIFGLSFVGSSLVGVTYYLTGSWIAIEIFKSPGFAAVTGLTALWIAISTLEKLIAEVFRGFHRIPAAALFGGVGSSFLLLLAIGGLYLTQQTSVELVLTFAVAAGLLSVLVGGTLLFLRTRALAHMPTVGEPLDISLAQIWKMAWPMLVISAAHFLITQGDLWLVGYIGPTENVAIYGAVSRLIFLITTPLLIANAVVPPLIAEMYAQGKKEDLEKTLRGVATISGIPALLALIVLVVGASPILGLVYGDFYRVGAPYLIVLSIGQLVNVWSGSCGYLLIMTGHQIPRMNIALVSGATLILGGLWAGANFGLMGIAVTSSAVVAMQNILMLLSVKKRLGIWTHASFSIDRIRQVMGRA